VRRIPANQNHRRGKRAHTEYSSTGTSRDGLTVPPKRSIWIRGRENAPVTVVLRTAVEWRWLFDKVAERAHAPDVWIVGAFPFRRGEVSREPTLPQGRYFIREFKPQTQVTMVTSPRAPLI